MTLFYVTFLEHIIDITSNIFQYKIFGHFS